MQQTNILEYLESTIERVPNKMAFANENRAMTFREVYRESRAIGTYLAKQGYYREPVVIFMKKHPSMVTAFFGSVYAGCFYVPVDVEMSSLRIELILENLKPRVIICDDTTYPLAEEYVEAGRNIELCSYEEISETDVEDKLLEEIREKQLDTDPIYVVFTSGSTGIPKGVTACHRSVIDYIENLSEVLGFGEETIFANQAPLYLDACLKEIYPTIKYGATTYLVPRKLFSFPVKLVEFLNERKVNTICWVSSALAMISSLKTFEKIKPGYLHTVAFGGEALPIKHLQQWQKALPNAEFTNLYGPTETTGMCCYYKVDRGFSAEEALPIGRPFHNTEILLITEDNRLAEAGEVGEICVRGTSLTLGYYHNFEKNREVFVQNPLNDRYPELIYRTGDQGKWNKHGELVFVSRKDHQIKHMGHRIELDEIEIHVNMLDGIATACCIYQKEQEKIELYYVGEMDENEMAAVLREKLPRYMMPHKITRLEKMPLTPNGKLDRVALANIQ